MRYLLIMYIFHTGKNLLHKIFDLEDWYSLIFGFIVLNDFLKILFAEFEYQVLRCLSVLAP